MNIKKQKIIDKIESLNILQASIRKQLKSCEDKHKGYSEKSLERKKRRFNKKLERVRKKIHKLELKLKEYQ
jgi:hypothetical protein